jgi:hypothetical protein
MCLGGVFARWWGWKIVVCKTHFLVLVVYESVVGESSLKEAVGFFVENVLITKLRDCVVARLRIRETPRHGAASVIACLIWLYKH